MNAKKIYKQLEQELTRLNSNADSLSIDELIGHYILNDLSNKTMIDIGRIMPENKSVPLAELLTISEVLERTVKIIALMEASENTREFKELFDKKTKRKKIEEPEYQLTDFDRFVKAIASVPKKDLKTIRKKSVKK